MAGGGGRGEDSIWNKSKKHIRDSERLWQNPPNPGVVQSGSQDGYNTATVNNCEGLQIGYNSTYGGAFVDLARPDTPLSAPGLCGDCDDTTDENVGTTNITNLAYFMKNLAPATYQK